jgi:endonuclease YncB( thermonuclease family)
MASQVYSTLPAKMIDPQTGKLKLTGWTNVKATLVSVKDGDTVVVKIQTASGPQNITVRAAAINAPESGQSDGFDAGAKATQHAQEYFTSGNLTLTLSPDIDKYGRAIGFVKDDSQNVNLDESMLIGGYARFYEGFGDKALSGQPGAADGYKRAEAAAKEEKVGIWANPNPNTDPDVWRDQNNANKEAAVLQIEIALKTEDNKPVDGIKVWREDRLLTTITEGTSSVLDTWIAGVTYAGYKIKAEGYDLAHVPVSRLDQPAAGAKISKTVTLHKKNLSRQVTTHFLKGSEPIAGMTVKLWGNDQVTGVDGSITWNDVQDGDRALRWAAPTPLESGSKTIAVSEATTTFTVNLAKEGDPEAATIDNPGGSEVEAARQQQAVLSTRQLPAVDPEERNLAQDAYTGYFTSAQTKMYIDELFIDELVSIEWGIQENVVPVFGYSSKLADAYAEGRSMIQGQIMLNYTAPWYLGVALQGLRKYTEGLGEMDSNVVQLAYLMFQGKTPANPGDFTREQLAAAKRLSAEKSTEIYGNARTPAVYKRIPFNITLQFGESRGNRRVLRDCKLTSYNQVVDQSGNPVFESYGFVGRDAI